MINSPDFHVFMFVLLYFDILQYRVGLPTSYLSSGTSPTSKFHRSRRESSKALHEQNLSGVSNLAQWGVYQGEPKRVCLGLEHNPNHVLVISSPLIYLLSP
jgi:hypothetical protein